MKKILKIVVIAATLMTGAAPDSHAQVFIMENESNLREDTEDVLGWPVNPQNGYGTSNDEYTPVGDGLLLLAALGGAYLMKKKKEYNQNIE
jgi:hypothetical protein